MSMALLGLHLLCLLFITFQLGLCDVVELKTENFEAETGQGKWFLEFYAPWCGHCKNFAPVYKEASDEMEGRVKFGTIDVTAEKDLAKKFDVNRFPTVKFYEAGTEYQYNGKRTKEGLVEFATKMLRPLLRELTEKAVEEQLAKHRYEMIFVYVDNNNPKDKELMMKEANLYRPYIVIFSIPYQQLLQLPESFVLHTLKLSVSQWDTIQTNAKDCFLLSVSPQKHGSRLISSNQNSLYGEFFATNQFAPVAKLDETNHRSLSEKSWFLGLAVVAFDDEHQQQTDKFLGELESLAISNPSWRTKQHVSFVNKQANTGQSDTELRLPLLIGMTNFTQFEEFLKDTLSLQKSDLPILILYDNKEDGYYKSKTVSMEFIEQVFEKKLPIIYTRNWFARKAMVAERLLNSLSGWQLVLFFVGIFVSILALMISIDYCCSSDLKDKDL